MRPTFPVCSPIIVLPESHRTQHTSIVDKQGPDMYSTLDHSVFWQMIEAFHWGDISDKKILIARDVLAGMNPTEKRYFYHIYMQHSAALLSKLRAAGVIKAGDETTMLHGVGIVSHIIALGKSVYTTCYKQPTIAQTMIDAGSIHLSEISLHALIMQHMT